MPDLREHRRPGRPPVASVETPTPDRILQVAARLFMEFGFDGVSMEQVAQVCDLTKAVIYYHFFSKANLFTQAVVRMMENIRQRTLDILNRDEPLYDRLLTIARIRLRIDTPLDFNAIMRGGQAVLKDEQVESMNRAEERLFETIADAFREEIAKGNVHEVDPVLAARVYMALLTVGKMDQEGGVNPPVDSDVRAQQLLDMVWLGIGQKN